MYNQVDWMVAADMTILRLLASPKPLELSPGNIAHNTGFSRSHISRRCRMLEEHGLLEVEENGDPFFSITDLGQRVVNREVDPSKLEISD
jgi:DNA-binding IclR family transcriptional regulator